MLAVRSLGGNHQRTVWPSRLARIAKSSAFAFLPSIIRSFIFARARRELGAPHAATDHALDQLASPFWSPALDEVFAIADIGLVELAAVRLPHAAAVVDLVLGRLH